MYVNIQNEIIELFALAVQRCLAYEILKSQFTGLAADGMGRHLHVVHDYSSLFVAMQVGLRSAALSW